MSLAVASRYANALVDVVLNSKGALPPDVAVNQLRAIERTLEEFREFQSVLLSPAIPAGKKNAVMRRICDMLQVHPLVRNFVMVLVRHRRSNLFPQISTV